MLYDIKLSKISCNRKSAASGSLPRRRFSVVDQSEHFTAKPPLKKQVFVQYLFGKQPYFNRMNPRTLGGCIFNLRESSDFYRCSLLMAQARIYTVIDHKEFRKSFLLRNADTPDDWMRSRILPKSSFCSMLSFCHSFLHIG